MNHSLKFVSLVLVVVVGSIVGLHPSSSLAQVLKNPPSALNYYDVEAMARQAIVDETTQLNAEVLRSFNAEEKFSLPGYKSKQAHVFRKFGKPDGIDSSMLFQICILTSKTLESVKGTQFTLSNLKVFNNLTALDSLKSSMGGPFFGIVTSACIHSMARFEMRLEAATSLGVALNLKPQTIKNITAVVFAPTICAHSTSAKKLQASLPYFINAAFIMGAASSLAGLPIAGIWTSLTVMSGSAYALKGLIPQPDDLIQQKRVESLACHQAIYLDLTASEEALRTSTIH